MHKPAFIGKKIMRHTLKLMYGFDRWHINTLDERPYAKDIIDHCNQRFQRGSYIEIGCGLGDILMNVNFNKRIGFDNDLRVLKAAGLLAKLKGVNATFKQFHFPDSELDEKADVMVMVNWIHHIAPPVLKFYIKKYLDELIEEAGELIIDTVQDKGYPVNHNIKYLTSDMTYKVVKIGNYDWGREVWSINK
jgi:2-polyprenyl-3-methyl-5-hydroxy-6-metoxy-1,4-benzoquinol methylase